MEAAELLHDIMELDDAYEAKPIAAAGLPHEQQQRQHQESQGPALDCYPYTFSPLLLFAESHYFDKGHSNYNAVESFFSSGGCFTNAPGKDARDTGQLMKTRVLYDRKNMIYEDLLEHITREQLLVTCCIENHFTAFQVLQYQKKPALVYYDPLSPHLQLVTDRESYHMMALFLLLKCNYGDSQHVQDNKGHYTSFDVTTSNNTRQLRRIIYNLWKNIHQIKSVQALKGIQTQTIPLNLTHYLLVNSPTHPQQMSTQLTGNTCYFQVFLFVTLCVIGQVQLEKGSNGPMLALQNSAGLQSTTLQMAKFLLEFFVAPDGSLLRPLTNSNILLDFNRYHRSPYYKIMVQYLQTHNIPTNYQQQYHTVLRYYQTTQILHTYSKLSSEGPMSSTPNTKQLQLVTTADAEAGRKLARGDYFKYRAANLMFGFNAGIVSNLESFCEFNSWRKNQLLAYMKNDADPEHSILKDVQRILPLLKLVKGATKYRDYYFMPQFEVGQPQLIDLHHYTYAMDCYAREQTNDSDLIARIHHANQVLLEATLFSTNKHYDYEKIMPLAEVKRSKKVVKHFLTNFMTINFLTDFVGLGFADINLREKEINSLTQTVFYTTDLASQQANRRSHEFEKECINQMARSNMRKYHRRLGDQDENSRYRLSVRIGEGFTYSKYNTLMHFLNVIESYWHNPDLSNVQLFGKDIRTLLVLSSQKICFGVPGFYHYGPIVSNEPTSFRGRADMDLAVAQSSGVIAPTVCQRRRNKTCEVVLSDRVFEYHHVQRILEGLFQRVQGVKLKSDNEVLNLMLLSLMLDFGLYQKYCGLLNLSLIKSLQHEANQQELQVECANMIYEFDRKNTSDAVTRSAVEELLFETSYKFLVNKDFPIQSPQFQLIRVLNSDPDYQSYVLLVKIYMSLCQINMSVEVDYYKVTCNGEFRIIIPHNFSKATSAYLIEVTKRYTFSEVDNVMIYDQHPIFDLRPQQPDIHLYKIRLDSGSEIQSMVKYIEISHAFKVLGNEEQYLVFIADNVLLIEVPNNVGTMTIWINKVAVQIATVFFNQAISFIPCFKYAESDDVVLFTSRDIHYLVDKGGQFCSDYYGMRDELIEFIASDEVYVDLNDDHVFKNFKLSELLTDSKTVLYYPDYLLQIPNRQHLINLLDLAIHLRNVSFFCLVLFYLYRTSVNLGYKEREGDSLKIAGPWREAIVYVMGQNRAPNVHYDEIFQKQFFDLNQHKDVPLDDFIDILCENFTKYQRFIDGEYQIVPRPKQKAFLKKIITAEECFHFSEVGSGKTKVILPLLCQIFLSNNVEAHRYLGRGGKAKDVLVILVPEHLVSDARTQVYRYCLNLNFRENYRVYDDIFVLLHEGVKLSWSAKKQIFVTSFNQFKKALTYDSICNKVRPHREHILVVADEVDDFLDRDKLVFNICSNKNSQFDRPTLDLFFEISRAAYNGEEPPDALLEKPANSEYWKLLFLKFGVIHAEIQDASRSINKSFGIFNEYTLRHCATNITHDIEGYKSLIARPYESVNRAMSGSYYSDVERTIYLTYVVLVEDIKKYDELFQAERKYISFEYWNAHFLHLLEYDDLVYGHEKLSLIYEQQPEARDGLTRFLYEIILRRMEIRDESRSVNSVDVIFNFDCIGFTGTPFLDNYPTFDYIRRGREDEIPDLIDRSFYAYTSDGLTKDSFEERFTRFQGNNSHVEVKYVCSDFIRQSADEMETLESLFDREEQCNAQRFNALVDLCGVFKRSTIHDVRNLIRTKYGYDRFRYVYHIDQADNSDRVLYMDSDNDVLYDEEFYRYLCNQYGANLRDRVFFFVDNRNVIGKDVPFQLVYQRHFGQPLLTKAVVLAHDVDDFSKIWQAMGRSRTMNETVFSIYKSDIDSSMEHSDNPAHDIKVQELTRDLYVRNCDSKMAGNMSSIFLTLVALHNLSQRSFYYRDTIVNVFLEKMERTIAGKVDRLAQHLGRSIMGNSVLSRILLHIVKDKFRRSPNPKLQEFEDDQLQRLLCEIVEQKFEQRKLSGNCYDAFIGFLSGEHEGSMEISYTKQQQKQKQKQSNKNQDSDAMGLFDKKNQLRLSYETDNYFKYCQKQENDMTKLIFNLPCPIPILSVQYIQNGKRRTINVYPTLQFLYSHHVHGAYITADVKEFYAGIADKDHADRAYKGFWKHAVLEPPEPMEDDHIQNHASSEDPILKLGIRLLENKIRQSPQYTLAGLKEGAYLIGMKDQLNSHDMSGNELCKRIQYVMDEVGFVLHDKIGAKNVDSFGPYFVENYILLEVLSKQEVAQNVLDYYCNHKESLQRGLDSYDETQGKGFVSWRFLMNEAKKVAAAASENGALAEKRKRISV